MSEIFSVYALCFAKDMGISVEVQGTKLGRGNGDIILTGNVGSLAKDSIYISKTLMYQVNPDALQWNYHMHFEYLQLQKDGPSWGLACFLLLCMISKTHTKYSAYFDSGIAATGELDLKGDIQQVMYIDEKLHCINSNGRYSTMLIPKCDVEIVIPNQTLYQLSNIKELF